MSESQPFAAYPATQDPGEQIRFRAAGAIGAVASVLIVLVAILDVVAVFKVWRAESLISDFVNTGGATSTGDMLDAANSVDSFRLIASLALLVAGIVFLVWVSRARNNAERFGGPDSQRRSRGWAVWGFICPVVDLWFPYQTMSDIYRASATRKPVSATLVTAWWVAFLLSTLIDQIGTRIVDNQVDVSSLHTDALLSTVSVVLTVVAAALIVLIIRQVNTWQSDPNRLPADAAPAAPFSA
jgi:Domain of unknown function (DUF4328)